MTNLIVNPNPHLPDYARGYIKEPRETFFCELKPWINPENNHNEEVMIAKACLALRNNDGGVLLIGFSDDGALMDLPDDYDPDTLFTQDKVQAIVSRYSEQSFGVDVFPVQLEEPANHKIVAIVVPGTIITPALCKRDSQDDRRPRVSKGIIYTRTYVANGVISSAPASQTDLEEITKKCYDNRVTDIGQFLRNHLTDENMRVMKEISDEPIPDNIQDEKTKINDFLNDSAALFRDDFKDNGDG